MAMPTSKEYLLNDHSRTLFPLKTTEILVGHCSDKLLDYIYSKVFNPKDPAHKFMPQTRCYSAKAGLHFRRTVRLDPVAEMYIYDVVHRNRKTFPPDHQPAIHRTFGYGFKGGLAAPVTLGYAEFRSYVLAARRKFKYAAKFDISTYFNSVYHHDLVGWFNAEGRTETDAQHLGQFLRETNSGRTLDCLPQGIHPCKMIGAEFLKFVDNSVRIRSELLFRLMDDFYLFSDDEDTVISDFMIIQDLLGSRGLSLNTAKTQLGSIDELDITQEIDDIKADLLRVRRRIVSDYDDDEEYEEDVEFEDLNEEQVQYLLELLRDPAVEEADAELVLAVLGEHGPEEVLEHMRKLLDKFPGLARNIYKYSQYVLDLESLAGLLLDFLKNGKHATEEQLFWIAKIGEDYLSQTTQYRDLLVGILDHPHGSDLSRAKVLEIPEDRFGMPDLRLERLRTGESNWSAWAAAVGCRSESPMSRNYRLGYFANGSPMNSLIAQCIRTI